MNTGDLRQLVTFDTPSAPVSDGDGGFTQVWTPLVPSEWMSILSATARDIERKMAMSVQASATHLLHGHYRPDVTIHARARWTDRLGNPHVASIVGLSDPDAQCVELFLACAEVIQ